jgi:DNA-binding CsgD family transcriptional regulator
VWRIPHLCLTYAILLGWIGQYGLAYEYVLNALSYDISVPNMEMLLAEVGIPLSLHMNDETTLSKCVRPSAIEFAFQSGEPGQIGPVAAAFAQWHVVSGRPREARNLLRRALKALDRVEVDKTWNCSIAVARFGFFSDIPKARRIIETRVALPCADVAHAFLQLFDAFAAQRHGRCAEIQQHATEAAQRFETLGWHGYADLARTLLPTASAAQTEVENKGKPFGDMLSTLSVREHQVAELVLRGYTNRAIADALSIKERTVEAHMTSILSHLGIRSRYQLTESLEQSLP